MALNQTAANSLLKQFIAQETSGCPEYFCKNLCTLGLLMSSPVTKTAEPASVQDYWTFELRNETTTATSTYQATGYERDILGKISSGSIIEELRKMAAPEESSTTNDSIIVLGENSSKTETYAGHSWPTVSYFGIFNGMYSDDAEGEKAESAQPVRYSDHLVLWGGLTTSGSTGIAVAVNTVPLFRKNNFTLTFTSN